MKIANHFSLVKEHPLSYEIHNAKDDSRFHVAKLHLNLENHVALSKLPHYKDGGDIKPISTDPTPNATPVPAAFNPDTLSDPEAAAAEESAPKTSLAESLGQGIRKGVTTVAPLVEAGSLYNTVGKPALHAAVDFSKGLLGSGEESQAPSNPQPGEAVPPSQSPPPSTTAQAELGNATPPPEGNPSVAQAGSMNLALQNERDAIMGGAQAEQKSALATAKDYQETNQKLDQIETPEQTYQRRLEQDQVLQNKYLNGQIDPNRVFHNMGVGQKIGTAISLIGAGLFSGFSGQDPMSYINGMIDRDIDAQKNAQSKDLNVWKMHREQTNSEIQANLMTRNSLLSAVEAKAKQHAAESAGPMAAARIAPLITQIDQQKAMNTFRSTVIQDGERNGGMSSMDPAFLLSNVPDNQRAAAEKDIAERTEGAQNKRVGMHAFWEIARLNTSANRLKDPIQTKHLIDDFVNNGAVAYARETAGRVNTEELAAGRQIFKSVLDNPGTVAQKAAFLEAHFDAKKSAGTAFKVATGMDLDQFQKTSYRQAPTQQDHLRNAQVQYVKQNLNNQDPHIQSRVNFVRSKYGI